MRNKEKKEKMILNLAGLKEMKMFGISLSFLLLLELQQPALVSVMVAMDESRDIGLKKGKNEGEIHDALLIQSELLIN